MLSSWLSECVLDSSPSSSLLVRSSTSSTSPNFPNRSFRSFWVTEWLNPPTYSRRIALYPRQHGHCTDNKHQGQPCNCLRPFISGYNLCIGADFDKPQGFTVTTSILAVPKSLIYQWLVDRPEKAVQTTKKIIKLSKWYEIITKYF